MDENNFNDTSETLPQANDVENVNVAGAGPETVERVASVPQPESLTLEELNKHLGKRFTDKGAALKALKDTYEFVGTRKADLENLAASKTEGVERELRELKENLFYEKNPKLKEYRAVISKLGSNPEEVVNSAEFKAVLDKAVGYDESQTLKTVLQSNPRIQSSTNKLSQASEAMKQGRHEDASSQAAKAVMESFGL